MRIVHIETLIERGAYVKSSDWQSTRAFLHRAIRGMENPVGSGQFALYPEKGKRRGQGNGVAPIKKTLMQQLAANGWKLEEPLDIATIQKPGKLDAVLYTDAGPVAVEWETGNISSSHRALNKMSLGLLKQVLACGILIVPSREMYPYLTDRIGNFPELVPYLDLWRSIPCEVGVLEIVVIEQDALSTDVPRIPKRTDGRALG